MSATTDLIGEFAQQDDVVSALEDRLKTEKVKLEALNAQLVSAMLQDGVSSMKTTELGQFVVQPFKALSLKDKTKEWDMLAWLKAEGMGGIVKEQVHPSSLKAALKELYDANRPMPEYIGLFEGTRVVRRKS